LDCDRNHSLYLIQCHDRAQLRVQAYQCTTGSLLSIKVWCAYKRRTIILWTWLHRYFKFNIIFMSIIVREYQNRVKFSFIERRRLWKHQRQH